MEKLAVIRLANDHKETKQHATKKSVGQRGNQKMSWDKQQWKHNFQKSVRCSMLCYAKPLQSCPTLCNPIEGISGFKRKVHSDTGLTQKKEKKERKISKQPNLPPKRIRKRRTKPKASRKKKK